MPIRKELRYFYPIDWPQLSAWCALSAPRGAVTCGRPHRKIVHHLGDGRWFDEAHETWRSRAEGREVNWPAYGEYRNLKQTRVVLATAHLDHDPGNSRPGNLRALCQRCHMIHDRPGHRRRRQITLARPVRLGDLFLGLLPILVGGSADPRP